MSLDAAISAFVDWAVEIYIIFGFEQKVFFDKSYIFDTAALFTECPRRFPKKCFVLIKNTKCGF
jgi:hypothetical protein